MYLAHIPAIHCKHYYRTFFKGVNFTQNQRYDYHNFSIMPSEKIQLWTEKEKKEYYT